MKKRLLILGLTVLTLSMSACKDDTASTNETEASSDTSSAMVSDNTEEANEQPEDDMVSDYINNEMSAYNWNFGMNENDFKSNVPDVTFSMNNDMSFVSETGSYKVIDSDSTVDFHGKEAYIQATFVDDGLFLLAFVFKFDDGSITDTPAKDFYTEKSFEYFDMFGAPDSTESENGILNTDDSKWRTQNSGFVSLRCLENKPDRIISYSGTVTITFANN
ncbi:MAG: hypothetical protein NC395_07335 [Prevotella sp.]|nr:hypothetical protein [Prevotella sp.]